MKISTSKISMREVEAKQVESRPFIRFSRTGCGLGGCNCSPEKFISISDGNTVIKAELTENDIRQLDAAIRFGTRNPIELLENGAGNCKLPGRGERVETKHHGTKLLHFVSTAGEHYLSCLKCGKHFPE